MATYSERAQAVKQRIDLRHYIASQSGITTDAHHSRHNGHGRRDVYHSLKGGDSDPSFMVDCRGWVDYHAGITKAQDVIDFVMYAEGLDKWKALEKLEQWAGTSPAPAPRIFKADEPKPFDEAHAQKIANFGYNNIGLALPYLKSRGINEATAHAFRLGMIDTTYTYQSSFGLIKFAGKRITIPYLATTKEGQFVREVQGRCHTGSCFAAWGKLQASNPEITQSIEEDMLARGYTYGTMNQALFKHVFKPRYRRWGLNNHIFNADGIMRTGADGKPSLKKLSQVAVVEGELDAILLNQMGFVTVSIPQSSTIPINRIFDAAHRVYIPFDNDNAGKERLEQWRDAIGLAKTVPINMPEGIKDVTEFWQELGEKALYKHLSKFGMLKA